MMKFGFCKNKVFLSFVLFSIFFAKTYAQSPEPLLLAGGFSTPTRSYSLQEVKNLYQEGKIWIIAEDKILADKILGKGGKVIESVEDFKPIAKTNLLLCTLKNLSPLFQVFPIDNLYFFENPAQYSLYYQPEIPSLKVNIMPFLENGNDFIITINPQDNTWGLQNFKNGFYIPLDYLQKPKLTFDEQNLTHLILTGVTAITRRTGASADERGINYLIESVKGYFQQADFVHISNEVSFLPNCEFVAGVKFCSKEAHFQVLLDLHTNIVELTGNHNCDYGREAFHQTFAWYQEHQIQTFGGGLDATQANSPLIIKTKTGEKIAFIGFNELCPLGECASDKQAGANRYEREKAKKVIETLKKEGVFVIASVQFGERDSYEPRPEQEVICKDLIDFGADLVYGSQAHQVQQVEFYKGKVILYGLGNFLFDQQHKVGVRQGYFLNCYFYQGKLVQMKPIFTMITGARPVIANEYEEKAIKEAIFIDKKLY